MNIMRVITLLALWRCHQSSQKSSSRLSCIDVLQILPMWQRHQDTQVLYGEHLRKTSNKLNKNGQLKKWKAGRITSSAICLLRPSASCRIFRLSVRLSSYTLLPPISFNRFSLSPSSMVDNAVICTVSCMACNLMAAGAMWVYMSRRKFASPPWIYSVLPILHSTMHKSTLAHRYCLYKLYCQTMCPNYPHRDGDLLWQ